MVTITIIITIYLTASGCRPVAVVIMHVHKYEIRIEEI
jgi:hypothetical protein